MLNIFLVKILFTTFLLKSCVISLTEVNQELLTSLMKILHITHCIIVKNPDFDAYPLKLIKHLSQKNKFANFLCVDYLTNTMKLRSGVYGREDVLKQITYPTKAMVLLQNNKIYETITALLTNANEVFMGNLVWITFDINIKGLIERNYNIYISYNCQFLLPQYNADTDEYVIKEIYHTRAFNFLLYEKEFGNWSPNKGFLIRDQDFYSRRLNMNGTAIFVRNADKSLLCYHRTICAYGAISETIAYTMNYTPIFVNDIEMKEIREYDGSHYFMEILLGLYIKHADENYNNWIIPLWKFPAFLHIKYRKIYERGYESPHFQPFDLSAWIAIIVWILSSATFLLIINHHICKLLNISHFSMISSAFMSFESFTNQCGSVIAPSVPLRIAILMTRLAPLFIITTYSAVILSFVTIKTVNLPFTDLEGLVKDGTFRIGFEIKSFLTFVFRGARDDLTKKADTLLVHHLPEDLDEGVETLCADKKLAIIAFRNDIYQVRSNCSILQIPTPVLIGWDGILLRSNSPYRHIFSRILKSFRSAGILNKLEYDFISQKVPEQRHDITPVELESLIPLYKLIGGLYLTSLLILVLERVAQYIKSMSKPANSQ